jgi:hypothetical protein
VTTPGPSHRPPTRDAWADERAAERQEEWTNPEWSPVWEGPVVVAGLPSPLAFLPWVLAASSVAGVAAGLVGVLVDGRAGLAAGLAGVATVAAFFTVSALAVAWADRRDPSLTLPVALGTYVAKVVVAGVLAFRVVNGPARWHDVYAASLGIALLAWLGAHAVWFWRSPPPTVCPAPDLAGGAPPAAAEGPPATPHPTDLNAG